MTITHEGMKLPESEIRARFFSHEDNGKSQGRLPGLLDLNHSEDFWLTYSAQKHKAITEDEPF